MCGCVTDSFALGELTHCVGQVVVALGEAEAVEVLDQASEAAQPQIF